MPKTPNDSSNDDLLVTWKDIAAYLKCSVRKAQRLERNHLPVKRIPGTKSVWSSKSAIDAWLRAEAQEARAEDPRTSPAIAPRHATVSGRSFAGALTQFLFPGQLLLLGSLLVVAVLSSVTHAYGLTIVLFTLSAGLLATVYPRLPDTLYTRGIVAVFSIAGMAYAASAPSLPAVVGSAVNMITLPPSFAYPFAAGLRFIPIPILISVFLVAVAAGGNRGFNCRPSLLKAYTAAGVIFLLGAAAAALWRIYPIWKAGLPIRWTLLASESFIGLINVVMFVMGYRFLNAVSAEGYRRFLSRCAVAYVVIALTAAITNRHWTEIHRSHLDAQSPVAYHVRNANAEQDFRTWVKQHREEVGTDLVALADDPEFLRALRQETFFKQNFDDLLQVPRRAVIFGYKDNRSLPVREPAFVLIRFPADLAARLQFESAGTN